MTDPAPETTGKDVLEAVRAERDGLLGFLERLVAVESPSSAPEAQAPIFDLLEESLDAIGYVTYRLDGELTGGHLVAAAHGAAGIDIGRIAAAAPVDAAAAATAPIQLLLGHCDTVWPLGTLRRMPVRIDDRSMHGPGVFDMKAGLAQTVYALRALHRLGQEPAVPPLLFVNSDEEIGSPESRRHIESLARCASRVFVMEPALGLEGKLKTGRKGVGQFHVKVIGKAAHAGLDPEAGASAILELSHQVQRLFALNDPALGVSVNVGIIGGGMRVNVVAPEGEAVVDVRVPDQRQAERISAAIHGLQPVTAGVRLEISGAVERQPLERNARNQSLWRKARELASEMDIELEEGFAGGGSDGNLTSPLAATLDGLGGVGDGAHADHEHIDVERSLERCALLARLLMAEPMFIAGDP